MKIGSGVLWVHVAVLCMFALTQGCVTTESEGGGSGARHRGIVKHHHKGKEIPAELNRQEWEDEFGDVTDDSLYPDDQMTGSTMGNTTVEPMPVYSGTTEIYIVQKGDVLSQIAIDFDTTIATLARMNSLANPDVLYVGQELRVPAGSGGAKTVTKTNTIKKGGTYTIQKGDTLSGIALSAGVSIDDLRSLNNIKGDLIIAGETLDVPSYGKVPSSTKKAASTKKPAPQPEPEPAPAQPVVAEPSYDEVQVAPVAEPQTDFDMVEEKMLYPGETLDDVARQYGISKAEIMRLNNISDESQVREGQRLRIPIAE